MIPSKPFLAGALLTLTACAAPYPDPEESGLVPIEPFPTADSVCLTVGASEATREFQDDGLWIVACPTQERGAIRDLEAEGGEIVGIRNKWTLISMTGN